VKLSKLFPANVQALYAAKLSDGLKPSTMRSIHAVLHCALEQAVKWNLIPRNLARSVPLLLSSVQFYSPGTVFCERRTNPEFPCICSLATIQWQLL
jgi:hypothetical protein